VDRCHNGQLIDPKTFLFETVHYSVTFKVHPQFT
jgi:hypothetical protein